jgi:uncharacterized protein (DUF2249 family)
MNRFLNEQVIDVRALAPRDRHPTIFAAWQSLAPGTALHLINDHDPVRLYYQFACEHAGGFRWDYLERGPETWRVRISKGDFPDPGFVPAKQSGAAPAPADAVTAVPPLVLDTRPLFARGETPCAAIDAAVNQLRPGQPLVLLVPFEPVPLYTKLGNAGFSHTTSRTEDGAWRVEFRRR